MVPYFTQEIIESTIGCYVHSNVNLRCNYLEDGRKIGWLEKALHPRKKNYIDKKYHFKLTNFLIFFLSQLVLLNALRSCNRISHGVEY